MNDENNEIQFGTLNPDGSLTNVRNLSQYSVANCPHFILVPEHYREDGSCKCNDKEAVEMKEWGYTWKDGAWR